MGNQTNFEILFVKSENHGIESTRVLGLKIWERLPCNVENVEYVDSFKTIIKKWKPNSCPCRLCKIYLQNIGCL